MGFSIFFSKLQESPWYREFLTPVINSVDRETNILDIGTGSGKMLQLLFEEKEISGTGIDTDNSMLVEAKKKLQHTSILLQQVDAGENYPFDDASFDCVTICSVLFNFQDVNAVDHVLFEALRVLKKNGKIIILTPTGDGNVIRLTRCFFTMKNIGMYIWYNATKKRAIKWTEEQYLNQYAVDNGLVYRRKVALKGFAQIETIIK